MTTELNPVFAASGKGALCVSIHDVAPETWAECLSLAQAVREVTDIPLTWLVVPKFHGHSVRSPACEHGLSSMLARGDELVLHGYTHLDEATAYTGLADWLRRRAYTQKEGEFAAIDEDEARARIERGLDWFRERGWPVTGFVAPAWLLGPDAWRALRASPFLYTTTFSRFYLLRQQGGAAPYGAPSGTSGRPLPSLYSPSLVYTARNWPGRALSPLVADTMCRMRVASAGSPSSKMLIRLALHPRDARYPRLVRHAQRLIERLLQTHEPLTKERVAGMLSVANTHSG
ncbi:DUF2334 domain-containing protein [Massilia cavernae]|uniref:DUF2334 domain-containing protein n=1 Tax=Massilia cavernae TaxID=2320864 RepID=A0A418XV74_9BURK|nr:polysaccharide deacetylase family protein [Massilia cavernae]RJG16607.1 DUF2334 domain-containing protein [Massilia cavernae]